MRINQCCPPIQQLADVHGGLSRIYAWVYMPNARSPAMSALRHSVLETESLGDDQILTTVDQRFESTISARRTLFNSRQPSLSPRPAHPRIRLTGRSSVSRCPA